MEYNIPNIYNLTINHLLVSNGTSSSAPPRLKEVMLSAFNKHNVSEIALSEKIEENLVMAVTVIIHELEKI